LQGRLISSSARLGTVIRPLLAVNLNHYQIWSCSRRVGSNEATNTNHSCSPRGLPPFFRYVGTKAKEVHYRRTASCGRLNARGDDPPSGQLRPARWSFP
jgi:hypothetical protein